MTEKSQMCEVLEMVKAKKRIFFRKKKREDLYKINFFLRILRFLDELQVMKRWSTKSNNRQIPQTFF